MNEIKALAIYGGDAIGEAAPLLTAKGKKYYRCSVLIGCLAIILLTMFLCRDSHLSTIFVCASLDLLAIAAILLISRKRIRDYEAKYVAKLREQIETIHHSDYFEISCVIDDAGIHREVMQEDSPIFHYSDIEQVKKTDRYVIIVFKGNLLMCFDNDSIAGAGADELEALLLSRSRI